MALLDTNVLSWSDQLDPEAAGITDMNEAPLSANEPARKSLAKLVARASGHG